MSSLPFPVRVAAGLVVTAVEEVRDLPRTVVGLPITAVSRVLQLTMRAQQVVTELAIKGDTALEGARPVEEAPSWATFDDDPSPSRALAAARSTSRSPYDAADDDAWEGTLDDTSLEHSDLGPDLRDVSRNGHARNGHGGTNGQGPALGVAEDTESVTPDALPGYESMTIAQLRGRLRSLDVDQLTELLTWESQHADRPPFVTMLTNRIATLTAEQ